MRYDKLLTGLEKARTTYENTVRELLANATKEDTQVAAALKFVKNKSAAKSAAWTPARRRKQAKLMRQRMREMRAAK